VHHALGDPDLYASFRAWATRIVPDYLIHYDTPSAARSKRTNFICTICQPSGHLPRRARNR